MRVNAVTASMLSTKGGDRMNRKFKNDRDAEQYANQLRQQGYAVTMSWRKGGVVWVKVAK